MMHRFFFLAFLLIFLSCESKQDKESDNLADGICKCYQPLMEINDKAQSLLKTGKGSQAEKLISEMGMRNTQAKECTLKLTKDARQDNSLNAAPLEQAIENSCPKIWASVKEVLFE